MSEALKVLYGLRLDDGRLWGEAAEGWQRTDAEAVLEPEKRAPSLHWLGRPKGGSKSTDLAGFSLAWLVEQAPTMTEGFALAADLEQANRLLDKARGFVARSPELAALVEVQSHRIVHRRSGARVVALAADVAGSEGLLTPWVVVDELPNWSSTPAAKAMWVSAFSAVPKWRGMRLVVIGHAGDPTHWSFPILERARRSKQWRVHEVAGPLPWVSVDDLDEQRAMLTPSAFARRHLNVWAEGEGRLAAGDDVRACVTLSGPSDPVAGRRYVVGVDLARVVDRAVVVVAHAESSGDAEARRVVLDRMMVWQGSHARPVDFNVTERAVTAVASAFGRAPIVFDRWNAMQSADSWQRAGLAVHEASMSPDAISKRALTLYNLVRARRLAIWDDEELVDELASVRLIERQPGVYRIDHDTGRHDDRAVALSYAATWLLEQPARRLLRFGGSESHTPRRDDRPATTVPGLEGMAEYLGGRS